jgi:beta-glucanase (GH16 family)
MPVGDLSGWHQVFADDFSADPSVPVGGFSGCVDGANVMSSNCSGLPSSVGAKWWAYPDGWKDTSGNGTYTPSQVVSIENGVLNYNMHTSGGVHMVAALVPKIPGGANNNGLMYGRYVVRFRADALPGYKTAFLLWPDSGAWPRDGEIDFPEGNLNSTISAFMHYQGATAGSQQAAYPTGVTYTSWHTAVIDWTPGSCRFTLDGTVIGTSTSNVPNTPMHWVLQAETALDGTIPSNTTAGNIQIAWVTAYTPA